MLNRLIVTHAVLMTPIKESFADRKLIESQSLRKTLCLLVSLVLFLCSISTFVFQFLSFEKISLYFDNHFVDWSTWRSKFLRQFQTYTVTNEEIDVLRMLYLLELLHCLHIIRLNRIVKWVHLVRTTELVEVKQLQLVVDDVLL